MKLLDDVGYQEEKVVPQRAWIGRNAFEIAQRNTPALWGLGVIEDFRQRGGDDIRRRNAQDQNRKYPEITGRVPRSGSQAEAWYGSRGQVQTLHQFNLIACSNELGLEVPGVQQPESPVEPSGFREHKMNEVKLDLTNDQCRALTQFVANLPRPEQQIPEDPELARRIQQGEQVFVRARCDGCHTRDLGWVTGIHSDMMLHDMGRLLCDEAKAIPEFQKGEVIPSGQVDVEYWGGVAGGNIFVPPKVVDSNCECEWRTPPLWGCADSAPYLHDGRAPTLHDAILAHGGEADLSRNVYRSLLQEERDLLLEYLGTLRAPAVPSMPTQLAAATSAPASGASPEPAVVADSAPEAAPTREAVPVPDAETAAEPAIVPAPAHPAEAPAPESRPRPQTAIAVDAESAGLLRKMLSEDSSRSLDAVRQDFRELASLRGDDSLADYALALAAKQRLDHSLAMKHFAAAAESTGPCQWLAERALVRESIRKQDYAEAVKRLEQIARELSEAGDQERVTRLETARWIGRLLAWLAGPSDNQAAAPLAAEASVRIRQSLDDDMRRELDAGADDAHQIRQSLLDERSRLVSQEQDAIREKSEDLAARQGELESRREELALTAEEWKKTFAEKTREIDVQVAELEKQYADCETTDRNLQQQMLNLQNKFQLQLQFSRPAPTPAKQEEVLLKAQAQMQQQLDVIQRRINENAAKGRQAAAKARELIARRQAIVAQYTQATGQAIGELGSIKKWEQRLERQTPDPAANAAEDSPRIKAIDRKLRSIDAYDSFDIDDLARSLLEQLVVQQEVANR
jgi:hypothetical protein